MTDLPPAIPPSDEPPVSGPEARSTERRSTQVTGSPWRTALAVIALALMLLTTALAFLQVRRMIEAGARRQFAAACDRVAIKVDERLTAYALLLQAGKGLFAASESVARGEWKSFVAASKARKTVPGYQGIGFSLRIAPEDLESHVAKIRAEGFPDYQVRPPGPRDVYSSIIYLEPFEGRNLRAFGYDMFSEPVRRAAMERAMDTGNAALSHKVTLVQEDGHDVQAGALLYVPVYRNGAPVDTVAQRREALTGWVYSPYRMSDLMLGILPDWKTDSGSPNDLRVYDGDAPDAANLLFDSNPGKRLEPRNTIFREQRTIDFNGHHWLLEFRGQPHSGVPDYLPAWGTLVAGTVISALVFGLLLVIFKRSDALRTSEALAAQIRGMAFHDSLTCLPNRRLLADRLEMALAACRRAGIHGALMMVDLDNFKPLNDAHGHAAGDLMLVEIARRLRSCVRETDTVARLGGDEFVVLLAALGTDAKSAAEECSSVAEKIRAALDRACVITPESPHGSAPPIRHHCPGSIGITLFDGSDTDPTAIIARADDAMYRAKKAGRNRVAVWTPPAA